MDALPREVIAPLESALVRRLASEDRVRAMRVAVEALLGEIRFVDASLATRLEGTLRELVATATP